MSTPTVPIVTKVAHTGADELRFHGHKVFAELLGCVSVGQMLMLGICGKLLDAAEISIFDDVVTVMSSADPRLWPFKVTRLASSYGTIASGVAATLVSSVGGMYGANRLEAIARWFRNLATESRITDDAVLAAIDQDRPGFGVRYRARDERYDALVTCLRAQGHDRKPFIQLCLRSVNLARERRALEPHVFMAIAALCLDLGLTDDAIAGVGAMLLFHASLANACEGATQRPAILRELPRSSVSYVGQVHRMSERARAHCDR